MRQIALLPAGCQQGFDGGVATTANYVCYASSIAIYFLDPDTFSVLKIIAYNSRTICSFSINPIDSNRMLVGSIDGTVCAWDIGMEEIVSRVAVGLNNRSFVDWDRFDPDMCVVAVNNPYIHVYIWRAAPREEGDGEKRESEQLVPLKNLPDTRSRLVTALKCSPLTKGLFVIGCDDGTIIINSTTPGYKHKSLPSPASSTSGGDGAGGEVKDLQWDVKSNLYLLVAYSHVIALWDVESGSAVHTFDKQGTGVCAMSWMGWTAGNFVSSNRKTGILKIWNVSQRQALESVRLPVTGGILGISFSSTKPVAVCSCTDGSVIAYDFIKREVVNSTNAGHSDTVFDCCFSPKDPNIIATASFDGTIKMWNITELTLLQTFNDPNSVFYSCSWSPCGKLLVCCTIKGEVIFWNIENGRAVIRYHHHTKASYSVRWNQCTVTSHVICSTSSDGSVVVFEIPLELLADARSGAGVMLGSNKKRNNIQEETSTLCRIQHSSPAFGCAWCPTHSHILCVGYGDGLLRVYDYMTSSTNPSPLFSLKGHSERVFSCAWSPLVSGMLATGSDDKTIAVWKLDLDIAANHSSQPQKGKMMDTLKNMKREEISTIIPYKILHGHKSKVRALAWNYEHADVLQSGSWDASIKIWNITGGECMQTMYSHLLDVYTVASHPKRPFTYVSTSRDTTIRVWELEGVFTRMRIRTIMDFSMECYISGNTDGDGKSTGNETGSIASIPTATAVLAEGGSDTTDVTLTASYVIDGAPNLEDGGGSVTLLRSVLCGQHSKLLAARIKATREKVLLTAGKVDNDTSMTFWDLCCADDSHRLEVISVLQEIFDFFCGSNGSVQLWQAAQLVVDKANNTGGGGGSSLRPTHSISYTGIGSGGNRRHHGSVSVNASVVLENRILGIARSEALQAESQVPLSKRNSDTETDVRYKDLLRKAALAHLKAGDFIKYCELLVELGEWLEAIAFAPCISHDFWEGLTRIYAAYISSDQTAAVAIPYFIAVGRDYEAVEDCLDCRDYKNAMVLTKMSEERTDMIAAYDAGDNSKADKALAASTRKMALVQLFATARSVKPVCRQRTETEDEQYRVMARRVLSKLIQESWDKSQVFEAATQCFVVGDIATAYHLLTLGCEDDAAFALGVCFRMPTDKGLIKSISKRCVDLGDLDLCNTIIIKFFPHTELSKSGSVTTQKADFRSPRERKFAPQAERLSEADIERGMLISRHKRASISTVAKGDLLQAYGLPPLHIWLQLGVEMEAIGHDADALGCFSVCGDLAQAVRISIETLKGYILVARGGKLMLPPSAAKIYSRSKQIMASEVLDIQQRNLFLCCMLWIGAHQAVHAGCCKIAWKMLRVLKKSLLAKAIPFSLSAFDVECQELMILLASGDIAGHHLLLTMATTLLQGGDLSRYESKAFPTEQDKVKVCIINLHTAAQENCHCDFCGRNQTISNILETSAKFSSREEKSNIWKCANSPEYAALKASLSLLPLLPITACGSQKDVESGRIDISGLSAVRTGSLLPQANHRLKRHTCFICSEYIQGSSVLLQDGISTISINDAAMWNTFMPFSPLMDGSFIEFFF